MFYKGSWKLFELCSSLGVKLKGGCLIEVALIVEMRLNIEDFTAYFYSLPNDPFVTYEQKDGEWLHYFGKAERFDRLVSVGDFVSAKQFIGVEGRIVIHEVELMPNRVVSVSAIVVESSPELTRLASKIETEGF